MSTGVTRGRRSSIIDFVRRNNSRKQKLLLYGNLYSPPCRIVSITLECLNLKYKLMEIWPLKGEHQTPEFLEMNPQHTIPVLKDGDDFTLSESRAIAVYLVEQFGKDGKLLPSNDPEKHAKVIQMLHFDATVFWPAVKALTFPYLLKQGPPPQEVFDAVNEALKTVSSLVRGGFVGSKAHMTLADLAFMATYSSLRASKLVDHKSFWYVEAWFKRCKNQIPRYDHCNGKGAKDFGKVIRERKAELEQ